MTRTVTMMMLTSCAIGSMTAAGEERAAARLAPSRLAIYYGYPSLVNGAGGDVDRAVAAFADYDVIVLGDGLEFEDVDARRMPPGPGPDEHRRTRAIIERLRKRSPSLRIYGYVDLGNSQKLTDPEIMDRARRWSRMGATGIFLDEAGYDYGVTRARQNAAMDLIHRLGLSAFVNAFNPEDVFGSSAVPLNSVGGGNPAGTPPRIGERDVFLLESFQVRLGEPENWNAWSKRTAAAVKHRERFKTEIFAVTTSTTRTPSSRVTELYDYAWWSAAAWGLDGFGWGEPDFSGATSTLPPRRTPMPPGGLGSQFVSGLTETAQGFERSTDAGRIFLSRADRTGRFIPRPR